MIVLGLTGSIGMGKSTAVRIFQTMGFSSHASDEAVHSLLDLGGEAVSDVLKAFPDVVRHHENGAQSVDRKKLGALVFSNESKLKTLENILHPMVIQKQTDFLKDCLQNEQQLIVLDVPLLYETKGEERCDAVLVVTTSNAEQKKRVLERPGMTEEKLNAILSRQIPNEDKIKRADFVLEMTGGEELAEAKIKTLLPELLAIEPTYYKTLGK